MGNLKGFENYKGLEEAQDLGVRPKGQTKESNDGFIKNNMRGKAA